MHLISTKTSQEGIECTKVKSSQGLTVPVYILRLVLLSNFPGFGAKGLKLDLKLKANTENYILLTPKKFVGEIDKALQGWR